MTTQEKVTISLPKDLVNTLREIIPNRKRSKFITDLLKKQFQKQKEQALIKAYKDAYTEIKTENQEFDGVTGDGIS
ncbi:ribbon-helix-helix domain-containing protein [bacterium]|jgi:metal-responsive CopG/Arc/MetJ family transcriptional regulator|nr:ribbon-helix-helix domain-containing protein [bacterium]MBU4362617.1 ribbon-helix-helix domain-containing protein [bacterium]MBU4602855.1 ribbon-helix-helix domain-containing protein [bacterium]MCG2821937.1 ribbon-helix-helix domain-containing protein [Candidatus Atribacteria bacterium]